MFTFKESDQNQVDAVEVVEVQLKLQDHLQRQQRLSSLNLELCRIEVRLFDCTGNQALVLLLS